MRERPSEEEAAAVMASGGDMEVDDGHATHLRRRSTDADDMAVGSAPAHSGASPGSSQPEGAVAIDMPPAETPFAAQHAAADGGGGGGAVGGAGAAAGAGSPPISPTSLTSTGSEGPLRSASLMSDGSSDGEALPDADAPVHNYAGKMVRVLLISRDTTWHVSRHRAEAS